MTCPGCDEAKPIKARGLCAACYTQRQKTGSTVRVRTRGLKGKPCTVEGCDKIAHGRGLCHMHLRRERVSGTLADPREGRGKLMTEHDLYPQWVDFKRARNPRPVIDLWKEDFWAFLAGVGERPSRRHRLHRIDKTKPMGPSNFEWRIALVEKLPGEDIGAYQKRYRAAHKDHYGTDYHNAALTSRYGLTVSDLQAMAIAQNHRCAICDELESELRNGKAKHLAVDHDHNTGAVRGLLCSACNTGIGKFKDDPKLLQAAIAYLAKHAAPA